MVQCTLFEIGIRRAAVVDFAVRMKSRWGAGRAPCRFYKKILSNSAYYISTCFFLKLIIKKECLVRRITSDACLKTAITHSI